MLMVIKRGDIFYADLRPVVGSEQGGIRPVIVLQNDAGNKYSPTIICAAITSKMNKAKLPTHVPIDCHRCELEKADHPAYVWTMFVTVAIDAFQCIK